jgi:outer membrane protein assembly factor BamA
MKKYLLTAFWIMILFSAKTYAGENNTTTPEADKEEEWGIGTHPIIGYETRYGLTLGAGAVIYFEPEDKNQDCDEIELTATGNQSEQYDLMLIYSKYFKNNKWIIDGEFGYQDYPDDFESDDYNAVFLPFEIGVSYKIREHLYIGPSYNFLYSSIQADDEDSEFARSNTLGIGRMYGSGIGGQLTYKDTPKGQIYNREGKIFKISGSYHSPMFLGSSEFTNIKIDYRQYFPVLSQCVFAYQLCGKTSFGEVPFFEMPDLEGKDILRGGSYEKGKYFLASQAEFRFPLFWRFGAAVFAGAGEVEDTVQDFGKDICIAGGVGGRIALNRKKNINIRFDYAYNNKGESNMYIKIKEAF